jgi:bacterioferritin (cytochrome b1)
MKDSEKLRKILNQRLTDELAAISLYVGTSKMRNNWTYGILKKTFENQMFDEMHYASWLIQRIFFFEGIAAVKKLNTMSIAKTDLKLVKNNCDAEIKELLAYSDRISP